MKYHVKKSIDQERVIVFTVPDYNTFIFEIRDAGIRDDVLAKYFYKDSYSGVARAALKFMETGGKFEVGDKVFVPKANASKGADGIVTFIQECNPPLYFVNDWNEGVFEIELYKIFSDDEDQG